MNGKGWASPRQDVVSGIYDFAFRPLIENHGRWAAPDPIGTSSARLNDPQSWNQYAYVGNNPLAARDPLGLEGEIINGQGEMSTDEFLNMIVDALDDLPPSDPATIDLMESNGSNMDGDNTGASDNQDVIVTDITVRSDSCAYCGRSGSSGGNAPAQSLEDAANHWNRPNDVYPPLAQGVFQGQRQMWSAANQITDVRTIALWYGGSTIEGLLLVPSAGEAVVSTVYDGWVTFETAFPGATADILQQLTPPTSIPSTLPGALVFAGQEIYSYYHED